MHGRILFIDAYDSFSHNIINLLRNELHVTVDSIRIDDKRLVLNDDAFFHRLDHYDAVVAGPGPGRPDNDKDVGLIGKLWHLPPQHTLPVLGICLGFQSLCLAFGGTVARLNQPRHGIVTPITHQSAGIFAKVALLLATQYHSLHVRLPIDPAQLWQPCGDLTPLAWDLSDADNGPILMSVQHNNKPLVGVQFHPESICTNPEGARLIRSWWQQAIAWNQSHGRTISPSINGTTEPHSNRSTSVQSQAPRAVASRSYALSDAYDALALISRLRRSQRTEPFVLQSGISNGTPVNNETGRYTIIGLHDERSHSIRYSCAAREITTTMYDETCVQKDANATDVFHLLDRHLTATGIIEGPPVPFWGGFIGFVSYEAGLESIHVALSISDKQAADLWFVYVDRSIVIDHVDHRAYVQSLRWKDDKWLDETLNVLMSASQAQSDEIKSSAGVIHAPSKDDYCSRVRTCQEHLRAGSSYELCLTEQTTLTSDVDAWSLYKRLTKLNPAPFAAYLRFEDPADAQAGVSIVSSSPERFLSWSRDGLCQFRPIKGTVLKTEAVSKDDAEAVLKSKKEQAENLMIVDLIRHDLSGVQGVSNVRVPSLMAIEEYATVFQLVSVIEGDLAPGQSGINVLAASLPPGSMTGAPKRRSCELLKTIEQNQPRSIYSGVIGYLDVGGGGDFSVVIRTAFKWDAEPVWRVGAGGAVTVLSDADAEYAEMITKRERLMTAFG